MTTKKFLFPQAIIFTIVISSIRVSTETGILSQNPKFSKHLSYTNKDLISSYKITSENVIFSYALCEIKSRKIIDHRICVLTLEWINWDSSIRQKSCDIQLIKRRPEDPDYRRYKLAYSTGDDLIFAWKQFDESDGNKRQTRSQMPQTSYVQEYLKLLVINMETCNVREIGITVDDRPVRDKDDIEALSIVMRNDGSFDALFRNRHLCGERKRCGPSYESALRKFNTSSGVSLPVNYYASAEAYPLATSNGIVRAYVVYSRFYQDGLLQIISLNGSVLLEHAYSYSLMEIPLRVSNLVFSYTEASLGICRQPLNRPTLECSLFDYEGKAKIGIEVNLDSVDVGVLKMYNSPAGGFFILVGYASENDRSGFNGLEILEIGKAGELVGNWESSDERCPLQEDQADLDFFNVNESEFCYYLVCTRLKNHSEQEGELALLFHKNCHERRFVIHGL